jgi:FkbH-like protein
MYETEVNGRTELLNSLPAEIQQRFAESRQQIIARTVLPWGEHCTECNWPTCYTSCELYTPRRDGGCRLFVAGMVRVDHPATPSGYLLKIQFKRWGKLWSVGNLNLLALDAAAGKESRNRLIGAAARSVPLPAPFRQKLLGKVAYLRRREAETAPATPQSPDCFLFECYNPNPDAIAITLTIRNRENPSRVFQKMIQVPPGFVRERVPYAEIARRIDMNHAFDVELIPNESDDTVLYFGVMDFVKEAWQPAPKGKAVTEGRKWKCIVWDLDNTLWEGILVEDGIDKLRIRPEAIAVIEETDRRGILHSIASKNNMDAVMEVLRKHDIEQYFLHPQVNWEPKSQSISRIAQLLNIGIDSLAFVDDQPFEREEVRAALRDVAVVDAAELAGIASRDECLVPITDESRQRRAMYREEETRSLAMESFSGDYHQFLRDCRIRIELAPLSDESLDRVYELAQRTNQMNFSGNRYPLAELRQLMASKDHETRVVRCSDRFGNYGVVGFALIDRREPRVLDLMFSCRVQSKRVEHAVLSSILKRYVEAENRDLFSNYRKTPKNAPSGKVFADLGFQEVGETGGITSLSFEAGTPVPDDGIIEVVESAS